MFFFNCTLSYQDIEPTGSVFELAPGLARSGGSGTSWVARQDLAYQYGTSAYFRATLFVGETLAKHSEVVGLVGFLYGIWL